MKGWSYYEIALYEIWSGIRTDGKSDADTGVRKSTYIFFVFTEPDGTGRWKRGGVDSFGRR